MTDSREPTRDPKLGRAIREVEGPAPGVARLELLRSRIALAANALLESRRERAWWEWMTRWARAEVALAAAAMILAIVVGGTTAAGRSDFDSDSAVATAASSETQVVHLDSVVTRALAAGASSEQVMNALVGQPTTEWLLTATVVR